MHRAKYSIALVGNYRLHVGLRSQMAPLPGSPFALRVVPGPASAISTALPRSALPPLRGEVGFGDAQGARVVLPARDQMGNPCTEGGAQVTAGCSAEHVDSSVSDNGDGTYTMTWRSQRAGVVTVHVRIDGDDIAGSPFRVQLYAAVPDLQKTLISGDGVERGTAGEPSVIRLQLRDEHGNTALGGDSLRFGMTTVLTEEEQQKKKDKEVPLNPPFGAHIQHPPLATPPTSHIQPVPPPPALPALPSCPASLPFASAFPPHTHLTHTRPPFFPRHLH